MYMFGHWDRIIHTVEIQYTLPLSYIIEESNSSYIHVACGYLIMIANVRNSHLEIFSSPITVIHAPIQMYFDALHYA